MWSAAVTTPAGRVGRASAISSASRSAWSRDIVASKTAATVKPRAAYGRIPDQRNGGFHLQRPTEDRRSSRRDHLLLDADAGRDRPLVLERHRRRILQRDPGRVEDGDLVVRRPPFE